MNESISTILHRRSVRKFLSSPIDDNTINLILSSAISAPSSRNTQSRYYAIFNGKDAIEKLNATVKKSMGRMPNNRYYTMVTSKEYTIHFDAPLFIMVLANPTITTSPEADCAVALQNMFLAAHSMGIGSCWVNQLNPLYKETGFKEYMEYLKIPEGFIIYGCGAFGYPKEDWPHEPKRKAINQTVSYYK